MQDLPPLLEPGHYREANYLHSNRITLEQSALRPKLTAIFDRSAFHGAFFDRLAKSDLAKLAHHGKVRVHHTMVFLEETLSMYGKANNRGELKRQISFILNICNGSWFREPIAIWRQELLKRRGQKAIVFVEQSLRNDVEHRIRDGILSEQDWPDYWAAQPAREIEWKKRDRQHEIYAEMRRNIAEKPKMRSAYANRARPRWCEIVRREMDDYGAGIIERYLKLKRPQRIANAWRQHKERYPYFTSFAEGMLYAAYYATDEQSRRIDWNAQADIDQLCYLNSTDCIVSRDTKFMKDAFDTMWKPKGKMFLTTDEFLDYLKQL